MRTFQWNNQALVEAHIPSPHPGSMELLIRVHAVGVTPSELHWYPTSHDKSGQARTQAVPGHEFSGVVVAVGPDVGSASIGQEVFGMNDWFAQGATADYCVAPFYAVVAKPSSVTHSEAATVPIGALTAWQGLYDRADLQPGERVLVHGAAGAVGVFAVQLARMRGARVLATAAAAQLDFVRSLGAEQVVDYRASSFEDSLRDVDIVFDTVGGETLARSWNVLKPGGRMITIAADGEATADERARRAFFIVEPNQKQLNRIAVLLETRELRPIVDSVLPFAMAPDAYIGQVRRTGRGKLVVEITA